MKLIFAIYIIFILSIFLATIKDFGNVAITPKEIYDCNNFNMFACVLLFLLALVLNPLFFSAHFIYWIFHVGRTD